MSEAQRHIADYIGAHVAAVQAIPHDAIERVLDAIRKAGREDRIVYVCGNGGSAATASHMVCDFAKNSLAPALSMRCFALNDNSGLVTAYGNDIAYESVFAEQLKLLVRPGDLVIAISGSGNSPNVLNAVTTARERGATTVGLTGYEGGKLAGMVDHPIVVPVHNMQIIEDAHLMLVHLFMTCLARLSAAKA